MSDNWSDGCNAETIDEHNLNDPDCMYRQVVRCDRCGTRVINLEMHEAWHRSLGWGK